MRIRSFRVPFSKVVGDDATEFEFGPDDYLVVRPLVAFSGDDMFAFQERLAALKTDSPNYQPLSEQAQAEDGAGELIAEVLERTIVDWHLSDEKGAAIPRPKDGASLRALPAGLGTALYLFLLEYRGDPANPTTRS